MTRKLVLCDCLGSQKLDAAAISDACGMTCSKVYTSLCTDQIDAAAKEMADGDVIIACQQERPQFEALAEERETATPGFVDIRDRAGWGEGDSTAKIAALAVRLEPTLCAHSRAEKPACSNCLNVCPTGAITSAGEHVAIDPMICAGCGSCSAVCPSGAISYDAPPIETIFRRLNTLASTYRKAAGGTPRLLVVDATYGAEMISLAARFGRGLPADVVPLEVDALSR